MPSDVKKKNPIWMVIAAMVLIALLSIMYISVERLEKSQLHSGKDNLEKSVRRAAAACYAAEGIYPPDLQYICDHYGIVIDDSRYTVYYEAFAANLMPDITVLEN